MVRVCRVVSGRGAAAPISPGDNVSPPFAPVAPTAAPLTPVERGIRAAPLPVGGAGMPSSKLLLLTMAYVECLNRPDGKPAICATQVDQEYQRFSVENRSSPGTFSTAQSS
ncbi:MAG: hypothetical protein RMJ54_08355 [Roseiflexaceae bacterium]|nr:hypothetical protein [Roseiflexaceae bacterium]